MAASETLNYAYHSHSSMKQENGAENLLLSKFNEVEKGNAAGFLCSHKVARELAAEIWLKANAQGQMDNALLGTIIGKLQAKQYAPHKRLTDTIAPSVLGVSARNTEYLFIILDSMIGHMADEPIRGINKMLEIFLQIKHGMPHLHMSDLTKEKLMKWSDTKALKVKALRLL